MAYNLDATFQRLEGRDRCRHRVLWL